MNIAHSSPLGPLLVPALGREIAAGEVVDAPASIAKPLLEQEALWRLVPDKEVKES